MSPRRYPPAYLRYLKARLWNLGRPAFWGTAIFLSVVGLVIREYWANPDFLSQWQNNNQVAAQKATDSSLSSEDRAIAADIDNLPVLISDSERAIFPARLGTNKEKSQANKSKGLLDDLNSKQQQAVDNAKSNPVGIPDSVPALKVTNPFVVQAENLLQAGTANSSSQLFGVNSSAASSEQPGVAATSSLLGTRSANQTNKSQNPAPISALQAALSELTSQKPSSLNGATSTQTNTIGQTLPSNSLPNQISPNTGLNTNGNAPISPATGYTQPTVTNQPLNSYNNFSGTQPLGTSYTQPTVTNQPQNSYTNFSGTQPLGTSYNQPTVTNQPQNPYGNLNNVQPLPSVGTPTSAVSPGTYAAPTNIGPNSVQTLNQGIVQPSNQVGYGNGNVNPSLAPTQSPQSNLAVPPLTPGQYGGVKINGYTYP